MLVALISALSVSWLTMAVLTYHRDRVGPLRLLSRWLDQVRAAFYCARLCGEAAKREWRNTYGVCLWRAQSDR